MDLIKVTKAPVVLLRLGKTSNGTLHLTTHHMIFRDDDTGREVWICYPIIADVERKQYSPLMGHSSIRIRCRDFTFVAFNVSSESASKDIFDSIMKLTCVSSVDKLYAYMYKPGSLEKQYQSWNLYDPLKEFARMGTDDKWRITAVNKDYQYCPTYPRIIMIPESISDTVMSYAVKFRSKGRVPALSYYHKLNKCTITRCSQPMVGLKQSRSRQDEKLVEAIFSTTSSNSSASSASASSGAYGDSPVYGATQSNLIVDARPTANAMGQTALGAGTENMENYRGASKIYLGIDNIHVMRDSLAKVVDALKNGDVSMLPPSQDLLQRSGWLKHLSIVIRGAVIVARQVHYYFSHVLIHCSDGWDRTSQLTSLAQIFLDPYFRTLDGFMILVEKEWLSFGHRFAERSGFLSNEKHFVQLNENNNNAQQVFNSVASKLVKQSHIKYTSPVFHQFLDCVYQLIRQNPDIFEYNERFLRRLLYHLYSCQYGTFLFNSEKERVESKVAVKTRSVWDYFRARRKEFINPTYKSPSSEQSKDVMDDIFLPDPNDVKWWPELYGRSEEEMNPPDSKLYYTSELSEDSDSAGLSALNKQPSLYQSRKQLNPNNDTELYGGVYTHRKKHSHHSHHSVHLKEKRDQELDNLDDSASKGSNIQGNVRVNGHGNGNVHDNRESTSHSSTPTGENLSQKLGMMALDDSGTASAPKEQLPKDTQKDTKEDLQGNPLGSSSVEPLEPLGNTSINYDDPLGGYNDDDDDDGNGGPLTSPTRKVSQMEMAFEDGSSSGQSPTFLGRLSRSLK